MTKLKIFSIIALSTLVLFTSCNKKTESEAVIGKIQQVSSDKVTVVSNDKDLSGRIVYHAPNSIPVEYLEDMSKSIGETDIPEEAKADGFTSVATVRTMLDNDDRLLSASCVQVFGNKAVISYHLHDDGIGGALELIDITDPLHPVSISQIYLHNRDFNHVVFENEDNISNSRFWALADDPIKGYAYLVEGVLSNNDFNTSLTEMRIHGNSTNSAIRVNDKLLIGTTGIGSQNGYFQVYDCSTKKLSKTEESFAVQRAKHLSVEGNNVITLTLEDCDNNNTSVSGTSTGKVVLTYYENFSNFENPTAKYDLGRIAPIDGKNVILLKDGIAYVALSNQGIKAVDVSNGDVVGSYIYTKGLANGLDVDDRFIYIANGRGGFVVLDKTSFTYKYTFFAKNSSISTNYVSDDANGTLYIADGIDGTRIISKQGEDLGESCLDVMGLIKGPDAILKNWVCVFRENAHPTAQELFTDASAVPTAIDILADTDLYITFLNTTAATKNVFGYFVIPAGKDRLDYFKSDVYNNIWPGKWQAKRVIPQKYLIFENVTATKNYNPTIQTGDYFSINNLKAGEQVIFFIIQGATKDDGISYCDEHGMLLTTDPEINNAQTRDYSPYKKLDNRFFIGDEGTQEFPVPPAYRNIFASMFHSVPCNSLVLHFEDGNYPTADSDYADIIVSLSDNRKGIAPSKIKANKPLRTVGTDGSLLN